MKGFKHLPVSRLYIKDTWGYRGSYYLYENGSNSPFLKTCALIEKILNEGQYSNIITMGTSKGGTAALIFGLKYNASNIFSGACQFHIGDYLSVPTHKRILEAMRGRIKRENMIELLNRTLPNTIIKYSGNASTVHLIYSKKRAYI